RNVVIFGESGSGKSSVINAITQTQLAETSSDATGCTFSYQCYPVEISGQRYVLFDTAGLNEGSTGAVPAAKAEKELKRLLRGLMSPGSDGIGLLVYCVRSTRARQALIRNYNLFYSVICRKKVPIVVVVTGLENETDMQGWWYANAKEFKSRGMYFQDHACVTTLHKHAGISDVFNCRIAESRGIVRNLVVNNCSEWAVDNTWFKQSFADARYVMRHN
ncbi:P-loop containing nucleoside triphosphate hydrolase protein, partial [Suillus subalutaceus]|uniref:P-loop containing nucleoside triphosphate hydrolase protein n=1 Tax=Suillus subalutaceus TaxID=48586 RepID=UPI001B877B07